MKELGSKFNLAESTISGYENGTRKPDSETMEKIADYFEVSVDFLLGRSDEKEESSVGRAFFGGADQYTEDELEIARAAAQAAVEAYRKGLNKKK
ncbi:helix-turn-helix domain-containing protein [Paenibacillus sp. WC2504]|uniref:helix-turn-helix domain-containing protein n=1 Tax=Paenibacillus sp. WC2504 TaxID=3461403 RepID=UPI00404627B3